MKTKVHLGALAAPLLLAIPLAGQNYDLSHPYDVKVQHHATADEIRDRKFAAQVQKDAKDLAELCASLPADMDDVKKGLLGKDVLEKLKRVEKLSKRVREELTAASTTQ